MNVSASADQGGKLTMDLSTKAPATVIGDVSAAAHGEQTNTSTATRGNTIAIEKIGRAHV